MIQYNQKLGNIIRTYRKSKNISTQELAKSLHVSVGCINHIENAKNNVFKLDLLFSIIKELDIPISEILLDNSLILDDINLNPTKEELGLVLKNLGTSHIDLVKIYIEILINTYLDILMEYNYDALAIETISKHLINELKYSKNLIAIKNKFI